jgi:hypothetical protein
MTQTYIQFHRVGSPPRLFDRLSYAPHRADTAPVVRNKQHLEREEGYAFLITNGAGVLVASSGLREDAECLMYKNTLIGDSSDLH